VEIGPFFWGTQRQVNFYHDSGPIFFSTNSVFIFSAYKNVQKLEANRYRIPSEKSFSILSNWLLDFLGKKSSLKMRDKASVGIKNFQRFSTALPNIQSMLTIILSGFSFERFSALGSYEL